MIAEVAERTDMAAAKPTVFIVDDDPDIRCAVSLLVRSDGLAVETFPSAQAFLEYFDSGMFGCLVLDIRMPGMSGVELQKELRTKGAWLPIIFLTAHGDVPLAIQAIRAGAIDFMVKPFSPEALLERIHEAIAVEREHLCKRGLADQVQLRVNRLTEREREIMRLLAEGISTKQIAHQLTISPKTAENHRTKVLEKMNVDNPTQLAHVLALLEQ
jgi:two-component system, LuxR family, response regulator FixJ